MEWASVLSDEVSLMRQRDLLRRSTKQVSLVDEAGLTCRWNKEHKNVKRNFIFLLTFFYFVKTNFENVLTNWKGSEMPIVSGIHKSSLHSCNGDLTHW